MDRRPNLVKQLSGAFSGLLAAAIEKMDGIGGKPGWAWIFILVRYTLLGDQIQNIHVDCSRKDCLQSSWAYVDSFSCLPLREIQNS